MRLKSGQWSMQRVGGSKARAERRQSSSICRDEYSLGSAGQASLPVILDILLEEDQHLCMAVKYLTMSVSPTVR